MKKLIAGIVIGSLAFGGILLADKPVDTASELEPSVLSVSGLNEVM